MNFQDFEVELMPPWLRGRWGEAWARAQGLAKDLLAEGAVQAVKARFLRDGPPDALAYAGTDRQIERGPAESDASYRARLRGAFETWRLAGTNKGILTALAVIGFTKVAIYENKDWAPGDPRWWRFWIVVEPPHPFTTWMLGDGTKLGTKLLGLDAGGTAALDLFRRVVRKWKAAHTTCEHIIIVLSGSLHGTGWKLGDGTKLGSKSISVDL